MTQEQPRDPRLQFPPKPLDEEVWQGNPDRKAVALTFDTEGDTAPELPKLLDLLDARRSKATFFILGEWADGNPEALREIVRHGHRIGNHTYTHRELVTATDAQIADELNRTEEAVQRIAGITTKPWWRIPIGYRDSRVMRVAERLGYKHAWLSAFADPRPGDPPDRAVQFALTRARNGCIYLYHPRNPGTAALVEQVMAQLAAQGYAFHTFDQIAAP